MLPLRTILVPTDFSEHSDLAFRMACSLARETGARILALHVLVPPAIGFADGIALPVPEDYPREWREKLEAMQPTIPNVTVEHHLIEGNPLSEILQMAEDRKCNLIVLGTHGRGGLMHLLMGSVAEKVVRKAPCPVLTVRAQAKKAPTAPQMASIKG